MHICICFKKNEYTFRESNSAILISASILKGPTLEEKNLLLRSKFFPLRIDLVLQELHSQQKQTGSQENCSICKNGGKNRDVHIYYNIGLMTPFVCSYS